LIDPYRQLPQPGGELLCAGPVQFMAASVLATSFVQVAIISIDSRTGGVQAAFVSSLNIPHSDFIRGEIDRLHVSMQALN
jgi:hypothetical protein